MEELLDVYNNNEIDNVLNKDIIHKEGLLHRTVHIAIINDNKILLQYRSDSKNLYPSIWDISVGGHISSKEISIDAAKRELEEELGLNSENYNIKYIDTYNELLISGNVICNQIVDFYLIEDNIDINKTSIQKDELSSIKWFNKEELNELINTNNIVPHNNYLYNYINNVLK